MKTYLSVIKILQQALLGAGIAILMILPAAVALSGGFSNETTLRLFDIASIAVTAVMLVRPLADIFTSVPWIRPLVILRKGLGVLSASIVVSFILAKLMTDAPGYVASLGTLRYWSLSQFTLLAHLADLSGIVLLITSNNFSKRILGSWWKRVQRLSYVYFYASSLYVYLMFGKSLMLYAIVLVTIATVAAYLKNRARKQAALKPQTL